MTTAAVTFSGDYASDPTEPITIDPTGTSGATNIDVIIDGAYYGSLYFGEWPSVNHPTQKRTDRRRGWQVELGQYDETQGNWVERSPIGRLGGWIELNDSGYYPVLDGNLLATVSDGYPVTFDTPNEAYTLLYAACMSNERDIEEFPRIDVIDVRADRP